MLQCFPLSQSTHLLTETHLTGFIWTFLVLESLAHLILRKREELVFTMSVITNSLRFMTFVTLP